MRGWATADDSRGQDPCGSGNALAKTLISVGRIRQRLNQYHHDPATRPDLASHIRRWDTPHAETHKSLSLSASLTRGNRAPESTLCASVLGLAERKALPRVNNPFRTR